VTSAQFLYDDFPISVNADIGGNPQRFFDDLDQRPGLGLGNRPALGNLDGVADTAFIVFVMNVQLGRLLRGLFFVASFIPPL